MKLSNNQSWTFDRLLFKLHVPIVFSEKYSPSMHFRFVFNLFIYLLFPHRGESIFFLGRFSATIRYHVKLSEYPILKVI